MHRHGVDMKALPAIAALLMLVMAACANMGRPEGGPRDELPPVFVRSDPMPGSTGINRDHISIYFDENIQLEDAFSKVIVSPAQKTPPQVSANGHRLTVELRDTLLDSTTYTIDFADAIKDLNEGNVLDGFALDFSTGDYIDTLRISGMVLEAATLEPAQGMLVGVYSNLSDTAITSLPFERIARTNQYGQFTIRNLKPGTYRVYAVNDLNRDYHWDRSEDVAFYPVPVVPTTEEIMVTDTLFASDRSDSLVVRPGVRYLPNDILMTWFNVGYKPQYLLDYKRPERRRITVNLAAPTDSLPTLTVVDGAPNIGAPDSLWSLRKVSARGDSLEYWIADTAVLAADSLRLALTYQKTDTADALVWTTDTLRFFYREPKEKKDKKKKKDEEEIPNFIVDSISGDTTFLPPPDFEYLDLRALIGSRLDVYRPYIIEASTPWASLDSAGLHLETLVDTVWTTLPVTLLPDSSNLLLRRRIERAWTPGGKYRLSIDSMAAKSIYGTWNKPFRSEFSVTPLEDYSNLNFTLPGTDSLQLIVELLNSSDAPVYTTIKPTGTTTAAFRYLNPGTYYARVTIDSNLNGRWDTGSLVDSIQPEDVYYFAKRLNLKKNWDIEQTWILDELPVDAQKPYAIKKNKPKLKRGEEAPVDPDEEYEDQMNDFIDPFTPRNNRSSNRTGGIRTNSSSGNRLAR